MKHKLNKSKGFTLIELMVVIAIISLLSSVVLASVKAAREKAMLAKTVSEMKSLQTALELYRNQFGKYPGDFSGRWGQGNYDEDIDCISLCGFLWQQDTFDNFIKNELVNRKFISKVPHSPNYPNNCITNDQCYNLGYYIADTIFNGYSVSVTASMNLAPYFTCGRQKIQNYAIYLFANSKKINLPKLEYYSPGFNQCFDIIDYLGLPPGNLYCLSM